MTDQANSGSSRATSGVRVLLADDEEMVRHGVRMILRHAEDIEVVAEAANGAEAVRLAAGVRPDVVLLDVRMPVVDGLAAVEPLVALEHRPQVVMLTAFGDEENVTRALQAGATGFLIGVGTVKTHVRSILGKTGCGSRMQAALVAFQAGLMR
ncbi:response regulator [Streptomyces tubercidicus]|uniref:response regulator n=1 Tax=Streptomyces tubercidicus TaxID=47759 RepID=UPI0036B08090